ncbi:hypothetical protein [Brevibacterium samyangense]|uniref:hypothetical protein n=1 Tax=Brevibacterium samyangense TaxID=366888 RepID=UPI0031CF9A1F
MRAYNIVFAMGPTPEDRARSAAEQASAERPYPPPQPGWPASPWGWWGEDMASRRA